MKFARLFSSSFSSSSRPRLGVHGLAGARCADRVSGSSRTLERKAFEDQDDLVAALRHAVALYVKDNWATNRRFDLVLPIGYIP
jgi:hypothetical protein